MNYESPNKNIITHETNTERPCITFSNRNSNNRLGSGNIISHGQTISIHNFLPKDRANVENKLCSDTQGAADLRTDRKS